MMEDLVQMTESSIVPAFGEQGKLMTLQIPSREKTSVTEKLHL